MDLEKIMLSEMNQTEKDIYQMTSYVDSKNNSNEPTYKTEQTHKHRKKIYGYQGEGQIRSTGLTDTKYLYKVDKQQRFTV